MAHYRDELERELEGVEGEGNLAAYAANRNWDTPRGNPGKPGGPVLVIDVDFRLLHRAMRLADNQILGVRVAEDLETIRQRPFAIKDLELVNLFLTEQHRRRTAGGDLEGMPSDLLPGRGVQECLQVTDRGGPHLCH